MCRDLLVLVVIQLAVVGALNATYYIEVFESSNVTRTSSTVQDTVDEINSKLNATGGYSFTLRLRNGLLQTDVYKDAYSLFKSDVIAIFGLGPDPLTECILSSISGIPVFRLYDHGSNSLKQFGFCEHLITLSADYVSYAEATVQLLTSFQWKKIALMFEGNRFYQAAYFQSITAKHDYQITYIHLADESNKTTLDVAKKAMKVLGSSDIDVILLYVRDSYRSELLALGACNPKKSYVWMIQESTTNEMKSHADHMVVGFRLPRKESTSILKSPHNNNTSNKENINLAFDATSVVTIAIDEMLRNELWLPGNSTVSLMSNRKKLYEQAIKTVINGRTASIKFDSGGRRIVEELTILNLRNGVFVKIGTWFKNSTRLNLDSEIKKNKESKIHTGSLQGRKLSVTSIALEPFHMQTKLPDGKIKYSGFCMDLLKQLASDLKFTYEIHESLDGQYGSFENGSWNGMVREVMDGKADMIVSDLTITEERESVVDFTAGYIYYTEDIAMRKTPIEEIDFLQFMSPFSERVWLMLLASFLIVSLALFVLNYFSPYGYKNDQGTKTSEEFHFFNCFWFSIACMLQQGADHTPKAASGRILVGFFWFSILIWVSTYTANLAAFFTVNNFVLPITNLEDAVHSTKYELGLSRQSHLYSFFSSSQVDIYKKAWKRMKKFPKNNSVGFQWARERQYIHIGNGPILKYETNKPPCDLITIPGLETPKSYGFALRTDDPHISQMTLGILRLRDNGFIATLRRKYWESANKCSLTTKNTMTRSSIKLSSMVGVFCVLGVGCVIAVVTLAFETYWHRAGIGEKLDAISKRKLFVKRYRSHDLRRSREPSRNIPVKQFIRVFHCAYKNEIKKGRNNNLDMGRVNQVTVEEEK